MMASKPKKEAIEKGEKKKKKKKTKKAVDSIGENTEEL
jgi:hypothetical protein